jgi:hypothetical protein
MIKFFRKIRQNLLTEGKTGKYLKYAIGEIVLVMAGILLALQVNNWNEQRKKVQVEISTLIDIKSDIEANIQNLEVGRTMLEVVSKNTLKVIDYYKQKTPYTNKMEEDFINFYGFWDPDFTYAAFENLKSQGVNLISNESLRKSLINLHEIEMNILDISEVSRGNSIYESMILPIQKKYFFRSKSSDNGEWQLMLSDYESMINDPEFYAVFTEVAYRQSRSMNRFHAFNTKAKDVIKQIDNELGQLK